MNTITITIEEYYELLHHKHNTLWMSNKTKEQLKVSAQLKYLEKAYPYLLRKK